ncbi:uncharacterized protein EKO05_0007787 [Ascochyta rabiei]|uniref:uncharacterized protein n=1 Tax=Didymella rabiei TaxID=5454 RepID=UPI0021F9B1EB|nr:uncharacterized protein EKO05_0007787 [Ascochyta rabiei]UPX17433.1 hypothetical protein EKO05_0007787 [Ascochyta rabiei]
MRHCACAWQLLTSMPELCSISDPVNQTVIFAYFTFASHIYPFRCLHLGCIRVVGAGLYKDHSARLRPRHLEQHFGDILELFFLT